MDPKESPKFKMDVKETVPGISEKLNVPTRRKLDVGEILFAPRPRGTLGPIYPLQARRRPGRASICRFFLIS